MEKTRVMLLKYTSVTGLALLALSIFAEAIHAKDVSVNGYTRNDGTYVAPHHRSAPDGDFNNNWSTLGNVNPYTRKLGTLTTPNTNTGYITAPANADADTDAYAEDEDEELDAFEPYE
jgi:hypothetical protein